MPDEALSANVRARDVWDAIESLRNEQRESRHEQRNQTTVAIASLRTELDSRLRSIETTIAAANPQSLGPRINDLERWQSRSDGDDTAGLPHRIGTLEQWRDQMSGVVKALAIVATLSGILSAVLAVIAFVRPVSG